MTEKEGTIKLLVWFGIVLYFGWFLIFSLATEGILASLALPETHGFFLRMFGIFPLSWAVLFLFARKDIEKNKDGRKFSLEGCPRIQIKNEK